METTKHLLVYSLDRSRGMTARAGTRDDFDEPCFFFGWMLLYTILPDQGFFFLCFALLCFPTFSLSLTHWKLTYEIKTNI